MFTALVVPFNSHESNASHHWPDCRVVATGAFDDLLDARLNADSGGSRMLPRHGAALRGFPNAGACVLQSVGAIRRAKFGRSGNAAGSSF